MPNHCHNELKISGPKKDLESFKNFAVGKYPWEDKEKELLSCAKFIPPPPKALSDYSEVGYYWCAKKWGTKSGCYKIRRFKKKRSLLYIFQSAWSPPVPVILAMSKKFSNLTFRLYYKEIGIGFQGRFNCKNGEILRTESASYGKREAHKDL